SFPGTVIPRLADGLIKLYAWNMTQYSTILVLDADVMIIGWQKHHFLSHNASQELRLTFDFNRLSRRSI
ncbi:unnamed protein product, partial [Adineta steineri]